MIEDIRTHVTERKYDLSVSLRECQDEMLSCRTLTAASQAALSDIQDKLTSLDDIDNKRKRLQEIHEELATLRQNTLRYSNEYSEIDEQVGSLQDEYNSLESQQNNELLVIKNEYSEKSGTLQADIAALNATIKALESSINNAKKVTDICPTCHQKLPGVYIPNTAEDEAELARLKACVADFSNQQQQLYEEYNVFKWNEVESRYKNKLHEIKDSLFKLIAKRNDANSLKEKAEYGIKSAEYLIVKIESEIELHEVTKNNLIADIKKHEDKLVELEAKYKKLEEEEVLINQHIAVVNKFETIIKRDFRGYLLQDIIVYIDKRAKEYCKTIFGTDLIDFSLDGNNISITYSDKSYEALSGGERQKVDIIVQFAIRDVLCAYTGFHTNIIVLDEIFDNLDDIGSRKVIDLISHQLTDISAIFIISHHAKELNLPYDREIVIRKGENGVSSLV
jgi:DNA repair exonuclease SbcCD ATPase subunit